jgi:hypothetical protein
MGIATLVGGTIVVPHLRRAYELGHWMKPVQNSISLDSKVVSDLRR